PSPRGMLQKEIAERLRGAAEALAEADSPMDGRATCAITTGDTEIQEHLKLAGLEKTSTDEDIAVLKGAADCVVTVLSAVQLMLDEPPAMPSEEVRQSIQSRLVELAEIFEAGGYPALVDPVNVDPDETELAASAVAFLNTGLAQFGEAKPATRAKKEEESGFF